MPHRGVRASAVAIAVCLAIGSGSASAERLPKLRVPNQHPRELVVCKDATFALCASSTCTATGGTIVGNDGIPFPAASCTCPVVVGDTIADLKQGNMDGSCEAPEGYVYSTYSFLSTYPQLIDGTWQEAQAIPLVCPAQDPYAQCWNWKCTLGEVVDGVQLADCICPIQQGFAFFSQAGQGGEANCAEIPVAVPLFPAPGALSRRR
jgi:hypothetical protein